MGRVARCQLLPASMHPANQLFVQELLIHASLSSMNPAADLPTARLTHTKRLPQLAPTASHLFAAAQSIAHLIIPVEEALTRSSSLPNLHPLAISIIRNRLQHWPRPSTTSPDADRRFSPPAKALALYGLRTALPSLPNYFHDDLSYDEATQHTEVIQRLLEPHGFRVALSGAARRGCPLGKTAEFVVALGPSAYKNLLECRRQCEQGTTTDESSDVEPAVHHHVQRAVEGLIRSGYVGGGRLKHWMPSKQTYPPLTFSCRLDPRSGTIVPPVHHPQWWKLRLHRVVLHVVPHHTFYLRTFFLTGPPEFTAHATLVALHRGYELNDRGLFHLARLPSSLDSSGHTEALLPTSSPATISSRHYIPSKAFAQEKYSATRVVPLQSELQLFQLLGMPYVCPFNRSIFCQVHSPPSDAVAP